MSQAEAEVPGRVDDRERADHDEPREVGDEHHRAARDSGPRARRRSAPSRAAPMRLESEHDPEPASRAGERECPPAEGGQERRVADAARPPGRSRAAGSPGSERAWKMRERGGARLHDRKLSSPRVRPASRRLRPADEPGRTRRRISRRPSGSSRVAAAHRRRPRRAAREVERDRRARKCCTPQPSRSRAASRSRRWPSGRARTASAVGGSITERREGREKLSNTCLVFGPDGELLAASTARSTCSTSKSAAIVYRESEAEEPGDEPVVARRRRLADRADRSATTSASRSCTAFSRSRARSC